MATMGPTTMRNTGRLAGNLLRVDRAKSEVTQDQLADLAGVDLSTVERIEAGTEQPCLPTLAKLLTAVDLELRIRVEDYDDHDDVLDARYAAMTPEERVATDRRHDALIALVDAGREASA